jgi:uncharacterized phiE125 gp8 family phage protein
MPARRIAITADQEPLTLYEAKAHLRAADCDDEDELITALIATARQALEDRLQRALVPSTWRLSQPAFGAYGAALELPMPPTHSVQAVRYWDAAGAQQTLPTTDYLLDAVAQPAQLVPAPGKAWPATQERPNAVEVDYTAGYTELPAPLRSWMLLAIGDLYTRRERSAEKPAVPQHFADSLLDPYRIYSL